MHENLYVLIMAETHFVKVYATKEASQKFGKFGLKKILIEIGNLCNYFLSEVFEDTMKIQFLLVRINSAFNHFM